MDKPALVKFVTVGDLEGLQQAIDAGADLRETDQRGNSMMCVALGAWETNARQLETCRILLAAGADPNFCDLEETDLIIGAIFAGAHELVPDLLAAGANPSAVVNDEFVFDMAVFDYRFEQFDLGDPKEGIDADYSSSAGVVATMEQIARKYGYREPVELRALLEFGAKSVRDGHSP